MTTRRWIISHRRCWITVYVFCRNAQLNIIVVTMSCICIVMRSIFVNCPAVICSPNMLFICYGETPLLNCGPQSFFSTLINHPQQTLFTYCNYCSANISFHTIRLILCFQQTGEIDNLTESSGQSILVVL